MTTSELPGCGDDDGMHFMITDRNVAIEFQADATNSATIAAGQLAENITNEIYAGAGAEEALIRCVSEGWRRRFSGRDRRRSAADSEE